MINGINLTDFYVSKVLISKLQNFFLQRQQETFDSLFNCTQITSQDYKLEQVNLSNRISNTNNNKDSNNIHNNKITNQISTKPNIAELLSISEYEEKLKQIKLGILHAKLLSLTHIIKCELRLSYIFFIEKMRLKTNMENLFKSDDNFLYFFPQQKFFKFANNSAYKKLSYVFKSYKYRMNFLMKNVFQLWRFKTHLTALITIPEKESILNKKCSSLIRLINNIIAKHQLTHAIQKLIFFYWINISKRDQSRIVRISKGTISLRNFINKFKQETFYCLPHRDYTYTKLIYEKIHRHLNTIAIYKEITQTNSISQKEIEKIMVKVISAYKDAKKRNYSFTRKNKLLKIFIKQNLKNTFNKKLYIAYRKLNQLTDKKIKENDEIATLNDIVTDLKCDALLNGSLIIAALFKQRITCSVLFLKQKLLDRLRDRVTLKNTLFEYSEKYQEIISMLPNERRLDLLIVRNKYKKIFKLKKILLTLFKHQFDLNDNNHSAQKRYLEGCFYRWKAYICESVRKRNLKIFLFSHITMKLQQKIVLNVRNQFLTQLIIKAYSKTEKRKFQHQACANLIRKVKKVFSKQTLTIFFNVFLKPQKTIRNIEAISMGLIGIYGKRLKFKKQFSFLSKLHFHFKKWYNKTRLLFSMKEMAIVNKKLLRKYCTLYNAIQIILSKKKRNSLKKWRSKIKKHYYKSTNVSIDSKIIMNMSAILQEYEIEDTKVKHDIIRCKFALSKGRALLRCIYSKNMHALMYYFMLWKRKEGYSASFADLLSEAEKIKNENETLIKTYYDKKNQYKKIIYDYEYMKKHYCDKCMGESIEIDYKSINDEVLTDGNNQEIDDNNNKANPSNVNKGNEYNSEEFRIDSLEENINKPNRVNRTAEKENLIKEYQNEYKNQLKYYEDYINTMKRKKEVSYHYPIYYLGSSFN